MKKCIMLFTSVLLLSACASLQRPKVVWPGQNFDNYITSNGVPTSQYTLQNGNTAFSFKKACYYDSSKMGETLVIVGKDNIIESVSTPTKCPSYYDSNDYKIDQIYQQQQDEYYEERQRQFEESQRQYEENKRKNKIAGLDMAIDRVESQIDLKQTRVDAAEFDVKRYTYSQNEAGLAKAKEELKKAQNELTESHNIKAQYERELNQLKSMQYR